MNAAIYIADKKVVPYIELWSLAEKQRLIFPHIVIDGRTRAVEAEGVLVHLTSNEFKILYLLAWFSGEALPAKQIYRLVWQMEDLGNVKPVRVHIARMRRKLHDACPEHKFIACKWKKGYYFVMH